MPHLRLLVLLTALVLAGVAAAAVSLDSDRLSGIGSIVAAGGGLLAVIWFSASLWYQARQLSEQRAQFLAQFEHLRESSRRESLATAKQILDAAEAAAIRSHGEITSTAELMTHCLNFQPFKPILESTDAAVVMDACKVWIKNEGAALTLLKGVKSAAEVYFSSVGEKDVDYDLAPDAFVMRYGHRLWDKPYFDAFQGSGVMLSRLLNHLEPGRRAAQIALFAATAKLFGQDILKMEQIREDMQRHIDSGRKLPPIAADL